MVAVVVVIVDVDDEEGEGGGEDAQRGKSNTPNGRTHTHTHAHTHTRTRRVRFYWCDSGGGASGPTIVCTVAISGNALHPNTSVLLEALLRFRLVYPRGF